MSKRVFLFDSLRITIFCIGITLLFLVLGTTKQTLLIVFNMTVMSAASTFIPERKSVNHFALGSSLIVGSIVLGGVMGFYFPLIARITSILLVGLAFYMPILKAYKNIYVTSVLMYLVFLSLPFDINYGIKYLLCGLVVIISFVIFHFVLEKKIYKECLWRGGGNNPNRVLMASISVISMTLGWISIAMLNHYTNITHLYWIALTILVVIQGSGIETLKISMLRILVNTVGALFAVMLFYYLPTSMFWLNLTVLILFLFLIFSLGFSYIFRTLFIELFVLGFTHLLGNYQNIVAYDRIFLTLIGGGIVMLVTMLMISLSKTINQINWRI